MDDIDRQIVALLRQDARRSFQSIGLRVALSAPAVKRRVDRLEADGVIRGYTAQVDPGRYGWGTHAIVALYCEGRMAAAEVRDAVEHHPEVEAAYTVAGEASAVVHVRARDTPHLEETLERLRDRPGITRTQTQIVLSTLFERPFRPNVESAEDWRAPRGSPAEQVEPDAGGEYAESWRRCAL